MAIVINGSGTVTGLAVGGLPDGTVDKDTLAVGVQSKVLQVVNATYSTGVTNTTTTYADTGLTATITPTSATSKILVVVAQNGGYKTVGNASNALGVQLLRGATVINTFGLYAGLTSTTLVNFLATISTTYLDSPATTSATTYKTQLKNMVAASGVTVQTNGVTSTITLMEIGV